MGFNKGKRRSLTLNMNHNYGYGSSYTRSSRSLTKRNYWRTQSADFANDADPIPESPSNDYIIPEFIGNEYGWEEESRDERQLLNDANESYVGYDEYDVGYDRNDVGYDRNDVGYEGYEDISIQFSDEITEDEETIELTLANQDSCRQVAQEHLDPDRKIENCHKTFLEEMVGSAMDFGSAVYQVATACVIREDEIGGMVDLIQTSDVRPRMRHVVPRVPLLKNNMVCGKTVVVYV